MNAGTMRGFRPFAGTSTVGPVNSGERIVGSQLRIACYPSSQVAQGKGGNAAMLTSVNAIGPHTSPAFPGDMGSLCVVGSGKWVHANGVGPFSAVFHSSPSLMVRDPTTVAVTVFESNVTCVNQPGVALSLPVSALFMSGNVWSATDAACTLATAIDYTAQTAFEATGTGTLAVTQAVGFKAAPGVNTGVTVTTLRGFQYVQPTGGGTVTTQIGIDIPALTVGGTNYGIKCLAPVALDGSVLLYTSDLTFTAAATSTLSTPSARTLTSDFASASFPRFADNQATYVFKQAGAATLAVGFHHRPTIKNHSSAAVNFSSFFAGFGFADGSTYQADTQTGLGLGSYISFNALPTFNRINAGTITSGSYVGVNILPTVGAGVTLSSVIPFSVGDVANSGTVTLQVGLEIPVLAGASTNIGIRNASTTVYPPTTKTITATTDTIAPTATNIRLNNTSGSSKTLASTPTITDGQNGQILIITNTSAQNVVLQDQGTLANSSLRLGAATRTLGQNDNITLKYDNTTGDWLEIGFTNVV